MSQYIGKTISLISVTDNRYVGLLENIDSEKGTVTLSNVRCFGTEGRKNWGSEEIFPNPTVYQNVQFNGNDVKDLNILEVKLEDVHPVLPPNAHVAAAESQALQPEQPQPKNESAQEAPVSNIPAAVAGYGVYAPDAETEQKLEDVEQKVENKRTHIKESNQKPNSRRTSEFSNNRNEHHSRNQKIEIPKSDFDFATNNAKFVKENPDLAAEQHEHEIESANNEPNPSGNDEAFYNKKSSFFDSISTSAETNTNMRWHEEKELNMDTFGQASVRPRFNSNRGRGRGRGNYRGRGSYRGRGRGGNNNNNNSNNYRGGHNNNNYRNNRDDETFHNNFPQDSQNSSFQHQSNVEF